MCAGCLWVSALLMRAGRPAPPPRWQRHTFAVGGFPLAGGIASLQGSAAAHQRTHQRQNMTKIPKSQTNQVCVRHDGAVAGTKVLLPVPEGGHGSPDARLAARFQSGGRGREGEGEGGSRGPRVHVKYEQQQRETLLCYCCAAKAAPLSGVWLLILPAITFS